MVYQVLSLLQRKDPLTGIPRSRSLLYLVFRHPEWQMQVALAAERFLMLLETPCWYPILNLGMQSETTYR